MATLVSRAAAQNKNGPAGIETLIGIKDWDIY